VRLNRHAVAAICLLTLAAGSGCAPGTPHPSFQIGVDLPLTGPEARAATPALNGVRFFFQRHPTLDGFDIVLTPLDDAHGASASPQLGLADIGRFVATANLLAMIGPFDAAVARKEIPAANQASLAMVSPAASSTCLTRDVYLPAGLNPARIPITCQEAGLPSAADLRPNHTNNFFRLVTTDDLQGPAAADYAAKSLHLLRAAVISDGEAYGQALADGFAARLQKLGGTVVGRLELSATADPAAFLGRMRAAGAQAVYFGGTAADKACLIRAGMSGIFPPGEATPFLGSDGIAEDPACVRDAAANGQGIFATLPIVDAGSTPAATALAAQFKGAYGRTSDYGPYTVLAYDAAAALYAALDRAIRAAGGRLPARADVVSQLAATSGFPGATGTFSFDASGDTTNRAVSLFEPSGSNPRLPWKFVSAIDYSGALPY
jgi:branched-chain amino acid transport system substrate-binding protein